MTEIPASFRFPRRQPERQRSLLGAHIAARAALIREPRAGA